ncbi:MAG: PDZ domain-containing protein [Anaerolineales bacterium]|nr:MAG: PDZ domain-containing protein [Anaerolineales bacterium]
MAIRTRTFILILVVATVACQSVNNMNQPGQQVENKSLSHSIQRATYTSPPATSTSTPVPATPTQIPPTPTTPWTATPTAVNGDADLQQSVFKALWGAIQQDYLYTDYNGLDWDQIFLDYSALIQGGLSDPAFYQSMGELVERLADDHSVFLTPMEARDEDAEYSGENDFVGIGILTSFVPERSRITIIVVFPNSPADLAGIQPHDSILAVDGVPIVGEEGVRRSLLRGPEGSSLELTLQTPGEEPRQVTVTRQRVTGPVPIISKELTTLRGKSIGYILLPTFSDQTVGDQFKLVLENFLTNDRVEGLVIDNRQNPGGADTVTRSILGHFIKGNVGYFVDRTVHKRAFNVLGADIHGSYNLPLVVLVGPNTASFGEIFTGILKDSRRAFIIGEPTEGNIELLWRYDFQDGSRAWIARETFRSLQNPDQDWELTGIIPDQIVPSSWDEYTVDTDPAIKAALDYFDQNE